METSVEFAPQMDRNQSVGLLGVDYTRDKMYAPYIMQPLALS